MSFLFFFLLLMTLGSSLARLSSTQARQARSPNYLAVFGDSYSDVGNSYMLTSGITSYWNRRFTNGPNWIDYISALYNQPVFNFAVGGALVNNTFLHQSFQTVQKNPQESQNNGTTNNSSTKSDQNPGSSQVSTLPSSFGSSPSIDCQVDAFVSNFLYTSHASKTTAFIEPGGNDFVWLVGNNSTGPVNTQLQQSFIEAATDTVIKSAQKLVDHGVRRIIVWNYGTFNDSKISSSFDKDACQEITDSFNSRLAEKIGVFKDMNNKRKGIDFVEIFDMKTMSKVCKLPKVLDALGISEPHKPCINNSGYKAPGDVECQNPDEHFFYDWGHFSTKIHAVLGLKMFELLNSRDYDISEAGILHIIEKFGVKEWNSGNSVYHKVWPEANSNISWL
ncbi:hypothetical protein H4219_006183 [Mycoemilia scoparia]|uniref:Uncharacterized protein n=1 Tax=Mycoemilia scoparia TaxID=417184 RepID=A0A9W8DI84_9FUNG|nr:hypothetical protein H4219_006183 [Mycoemilia scoparia]